MLLMQGPTVTRVDDCHCAVDHCQEEDNPELTLLEFHFGRRLVVSGMRRSHDRVFKSDNSVAGGALSCTFLPTRKPSLLRYVTAWLPGSIASGLKILFSSGVG